MAFMCTTPTLNQTTRHSHHTPPLNPLPTPYCSLSTAVYNAVWSATAGRKWGLTSNPTAKLMTDLGKTLLSQKILCGSPSVPLRSGALLLGQSMSIDARVISCALGWASFCTDCQKISCGVGYPATGTRSSWAVIGRTFPATPTEGRRRCSVSCHEDGYGFARL